MVSRREKESYVKSGFNDCYFGAHAHAYARALACTDTLM